MSEYVGSRIVPKHGGVWDSSKSYEPLIIVLEEATGDSYISRKPVPPGTTLAQKEYWAMCQRFSEQVQLFREAVDKDVIDMKKLTDDTVKAINKTASDTVAAVNKTCGDTVQAVNDSLDHTQDYLEAKVHSAETSLQEGKEKMAEETEKLNKRIDGIVAGSGDSNAEIVDMRMDSEGKEYESAGAAARSMTEGLIPKLEPKDYGKAYPTGSTSTVVFETLGRTAKCRFSYNGEGYIGAFFKFFEPFAEIKEKKYRVVIQSDGQDINMECGITNSMYAWGNQSGTVGIKLLDTVKLTGKNGFMQIIDIDFAEEQWEEFFTKYTASSIPFICLRNQNHIETTDRTFFVYVYERNPLHDLAWKYVSEYEHLTILEHEIMDARNDGEEYASLGELIRAHKEILLEVLAARTDSQGILYSSLNDRLNGYDGVLRARLPINAFVPPRDNVLGVITSEDGFMRSFVEKRNAVFRFEHSAYIAMEKAQWGSLNFSFCITREQMLSMKSLGGIVLDFRINGAGEGGNLEYDGAEINVSYYVNGISSWGSTINKMRTQPAAIGRRTLMQIPEEEIQKVLDADKPLHIVFVGSFLNKPVIAELDKIEIVASLIDQSTDYVLSSFTGYADTAESAGFANLAAEANHAMQAERAAFSDQAGNAANATVADNFFLNMPTYLLNEEGKRYSPGLDSTEVPERCSYAFSGSIQSIKKENYTIGKVPGAFADGVHWHMTLSNDSDQPGNQGYVKSLNGILSFDEMLQFFRDGYKFGYVCALESWEDYPEKSTPGSHPQNLLISFYGIDKAFRQIVANRTPAVRKLTDKITLSIWKFTISDEVIAEIDAAREAGQFSMSWYAIWNTRSYKEENPAEWDTTWYWGDYAFTDDSFSDEEMLSFFASKYLYWASMVNHPVLEKKFVRINERLDEMEGDAELLQELSEEVDEIKKEIQMDRAIVCWGDSLTAGGGWTTTLGNLAGLPVFNGGTGGENVRTIVARQGADVMTINNITIPAACEPVTIAVRATDSGIKTEAGYKVTPLLQGGAHVNPVRIGDVEGTLKWTGTNYADQTGIWTFTRSTAGEEVKITRPTAIRTAFDRNHNGKNEIMVIFIGQNGGFSGNDDLIRQHRLMIDHFKGKEYVVLGLSSGTEAQRSEYEAAMTAAFGRRFVSLRQYLAHPVYAADGKTVVSCYGLEDSNLTPTAEDIERIKVGQVPQTLLSDAVHYTTTTKTVIGKMLYRKMVELGIL